LRCGPPAEPAILRRFFLAASRAWPPAAAGTAAGPLAL
jgi:hypothetical protein